MTTAGWIFMTASISFVLGLVVFTFYRVLRGPNGAGHIESPTEIYEHDKEI